MAKPQQWAFDKTQIDPTYEAIFDKATAVIPLWEDGGTTVEDLVTGETLTIVENSGGPSWATDSEGVHLNFPDGQNANGRYIDFAGTSFIGQTWGPDVTMVAVARPSTAGVVDDGTLVAQVEGSDPTDSTQFHDFAISDDPGNIGQVRFKAQIIGGGDPNIQTYSSNAYEDGARHVFTFRRTGDVLIGDVDDTDRTSDSNTDFTTESFVTDHLFIGDIPNDTEGFDGDIYAVYLFRDTALTDTEITALNDDPYGLFREEVAATPDASVLGFIKNWSHNKVAAAYVLDADTTARLLVYSDSNRTNLVASGPSDDFTDTINQRTQRIYADGLSPDTQYWVSIEIDGVVSTEGQFSFTTLPAPGSAHSYRVVFGNCNDADSTRNVWQLIKDENPDVIHHLGDHGGYAMDDASQTNTRYFITDYKTAHTNSVIRNLLEADGIAFTYTPDDHGYPDNNAKSSDPGMPYAAEAVRRAFPNLGLAIDEDIYNDSANHFAIRYGRVRVIAPDLRRRRVEDSVKLDTAGMTWVKNQISEAATEGDVVLFLSSVPWIVEENIGSGDSWSESPAQHEEIADHIGAEGMLNSTIIIGGDAHGSSYDTGINNTYGDPPLTSVPVMHGGAFDRPGSTKGGPYEFGTIEGPGKFGVLDITDGGGDDITVGYTALEDGSELWSDTITLQDPTATAPATRTGTVTRDGNAVQGADVVFITRSDLLANAAAQTTTDASGAYSAEIPTGEEMVGIALEGNDGDSTPFTEGA